VQAVGAVTRGERMRVQQIRPIEHVSLDHDRLGALYVQLGEAGAEDVVSRALQELAQRLGICDALYREEEWLTLRKNVRSLIAIAEQIGVLDVARIAGDVTENIDRADRVAVAATLSRLIRVGERSLTAVWDMQDVPF
jgi:hypothetical protein